MKTIEMAKATEQLQDYLCEAGNETLVFTVKGKPVAALVPLENVDLETLSLSTNADFIALIQASRERQRAEGGISLEEMRHRLGLPAKGLG